VISLPTFGNAKEYNPLGKTVNSTDVAIGAGIGLAGGGLLMYAQRQFWPTAPAIVSQYAGPLSAIGAGLAAHAFYRKKSASRAQGYLVGAAVVGVVPLLYGMVKSALPANMQSYFGDPVVALPSFRGMIVKSPRAFNGLITRVPRVPMALPSPARRAMGMR
jgi:hypothetical protein